MRVPGALQRACASSQSSGGEMRLRLPRLIRRVRPKSVLLLALVAAVAFLTTLYVLQQPGSPRAAVSVRARQLPCVYTKLAAGMGTS